MSEKPAAAAANVKATLLEVQGLKDRGTLRLTECGGTPLQNGDQVLVHADLARGLVERHGGTLKISGDTKDVPGLKNGTWEPVKIQPRSTETAKANPASSEGKPGNKTMAGPGKTQAKGAEA